MFEDKTIPLRGIGKAATCFCVMAVLSVVSLVSIPSLTEAQKVSDTNLTDTSTKPSSGKTSVDSKTGNSDNLVQFCNSAAITINDNSAASPYPSQIVVSGVAGNISSMSITLNNVFHTFSADVQVLLVGPTGAKFVPMSVVGGDVGFDAATTITISDSALTAFPLGDTAITTGSYKPTADNIFTEYPFPGSAPGEPYNSPAPLGSATFGSVFSGTNPIGTWRLYVADFFPGDFGSIGGGWCIDFFSPTANNVVVSGRVLAPNGNGVRNAVVRITDQFGVSRTTLTSTFGYYRFENVAAGATYVLEVSSKQFQFASRAVSVTADLTDLNFVAESGSDLVRR